VDLYVDAKYGLRRPLIKNNLFGVNRAVVRSHRTPVPEGLLSFFAPTVRAYFSRLVRHNSSFLIVRETVAPAFFEVFDLRSGTMAGLPASIPPPPRLTLYSCLTHLDMQVHRNDPFLDAVDLCDFTRMVMEDLADDFSSLRERHICLQIATL
jgi:hypothetical protein